MKSFFTMKSMKNMKKSRRGFFPIHGNVVVVLIIGSGAPLEGF